MWTDSTPIQQSEGNFPLSCDGKPDYKDRITQCSVPDNRVLLPSGREMDLAAFPVLRHNRILFVSEMPSYSLLSPNCASVHPFYGSTANVLERAFYYMGLHHTYFSYTPLIRCWATLTYSHRNEDYETCLHHLKYFCEIARPPVIISLGNVVTRHLLLPEIAYDNGKYRGDHTLRMEWSDKPYDSKVGVPVIPTKHPDNIVLVNCNSQINFKSICVDIMRAVRFASSIVPEYEDIASKMTVSLYERFYEEMIEAYKNDISKIK
jgi:uracil-DNA glycosylase family 4